MRESNEIIKQCLDMLPQGEISGKKQIAGLRRKKPAKDLLPSRSPRGTLGCYIISNGSDRAYRIKWRNPSFCNLSILPELLKNHPIADVMAIFGSIDVILPDVDRDKIKP